jgi:hypothetical protein
MHQSSFFGPFFDGLPNRYLGNSKPPYSTRNFSFYPLTSSAPQLLPSCDLEKRRGSQCVLLNKTSQKYRREEGMKKLAKISKPTGTAPSVCGKTYKAIPKDRMMAVTVKFHSGARLAYDIYPGSIILVRGGNCGLTVNVKFESGRPVTAKNFQQGSGYVKISRGVKCNL